MQMFSGHIKMQMFCFILNLCYIWNKKPKCTETYYYSSKVICTNIDIESYNTNIYSVVLYGM